MSGQFHVPPDLSNRIVHCPTSVRLDKSRESTVMTGMSIISCAENFLCVRTI